MNAVQMDQYFRVKKWKVEVNIDCKKTGKYVSTNEEEISYTLVERIRYRGSCDEKQWVGRCGVSWTGTQIRLEASASAKVVRKNKRIKLTSTTQVEGKLDVKSRFSLIACGAGSYSFHIGPYSWELPLAGTTHTVSPDGESTWPETDCMVSIPPAEDIDLTVRPEKWFKKERKAPASYRPPCPTLGEEGDQLEARTVIHTGCGNHPPFENWHLPNQIGIISGQKIERSCSLMGLDSFLFDVPSEEERRADVTYTWKFTPQTIAPVTMTANQLRKLFPSLSQRKAQQYIGMLNSTCQQYDIITIYRQAALLSQIGVETAELNHLVEDLDLYDAARLLKVFPKYFNAAKAKAKYNGDPKAMAEDYAHHGEKIANYVYANRLGNGTVKSGDGFRYRGRGFLQLTGRGRYREVGKLIHIDIEAHPERLEDPATAFHATGEYWKAKKLNTPADIPDVLNVSFRINGGWNGIRQRVRYYNRALDILLQGAGSTR